MIEARAFRIFRIMYSLFRGLDSKTDWLTYVVTWLWRWPLPRQILVMGSEVVPETSIIINQLQVLHEFYELRYYLTLLLCNRILSKFWCFLLQISIKWLRLADSGLSPLVANSNFLLWIQRFHAIDLRTSSPPPRVIDCVIARTTPILDTVRMAPPTQQHHYYLSVQ